MKESTRTGLGGMTASLLSQLQRLSPRAKVILGVIILAIVVGGIVAAGSHNGGGGGNGVANLPWSSYQRQVLTDSPYVPYSWLTPTGWTSTSRFVDGSTVVHGLFMDSSDSSGTMDIFVLTPVNPLYVDHCGTVGQGGICDLSLGTSILSNLRFPVYALPTAEGYIRNLLQSSLQQRNIVPSGATNWNVVDVKSRSDLANKFGFLLVSSDQPSGADGMISYSYNGKNYRLGVEVAVSRATYYNEIYSLVTGTTFWSAVVTGVSAPESDFDVATSTYGNIVMATMRLDPQWALAEIQNANVQTQMIANFDQRMRAMQLAQFTDQANSQAAQGRAWANALGGVQDYVDRTDQTQYTLPYDLGNYYYRSGNTFYPANTETQPSACSQAGNCHEVYVQNPT